MTEPALPRGGLSPLFLIAISADQSQFDEVVQQGEQAGSEGCNVSQGGGIQNTADSCVLRVCDDAILQAQSLGAGGGIELHGQRDQLEQNDGSKGDDSGQQQRFGVQDEAQHQQDFGSCRAETYDWNQ